MTKCWLWPGTLSKRERRWAYGIIVVRGHQKAAHRVLYELTYGRIIPPEMHVCHKCDVPACIRPSHLFLGTQKDNMQDASRKGRMINGDAHWTRRLPHKIRGERKNVSKLNWNKVRRIRRLFRNGSRNQRQLAKDFSVTFGNIHMIVRNKTWRDYPSVFPPP